MVALSMLAQTNCNLSKEPEKNEKSDNIPIFSPTQTTLVRKKPEAIPSTARTAAASFAPQRRGRDRPSIFDVYRCDWWNRFDCRQKLRELGLIYCHCFEDTDGNIIRCGYRGRRDVCKTPLFN